MTVLAHKDLGNGKTILPDRVAIGDREKGMPINAASKELWHDSSS